MLHRKSHIENHFRSAQERLAARRELLSSRGLDADRIKRDTQVRHFNAEVCKARRELRAFAAIETQMAAKAELRIRKETAAKAGDLDGKPKKRDINAPPAKKRRKPRLEPDDGEPAQA